MHARSMLGTTPLELSIDLGRNDIAFLLLSLRGSDDRPAPRAGAVKASVGTPNRGQPARPNTAQNVRVAPVPAAPQGPRLFAGDGGTPAPDAGFLGFGGGGAKPR
jgi:hypothetical protein